MKKKLYATAALLLVVPALIGVTSSFQTAIPRGVQIETPPTLYVQTSTLGGETWMLMIDASGLNGVFSTCGNGTPNFTMFTPREEDSLRILEQLGLTVGQLLAQPALVKTLILYHAVATSISPGQMADSLNTNLPTMGGLMLTVSRTTSPLSISVNSKPLVLRDTGENLAEKMERLEACNGWAYQIAGFLAPSSAIDTPGLIVDGTTGVGTVISMTASPSLTQNPYVLYNLGFSTQAKGIEVSDLSNSGTAEGCQFSVAPRPAEWNFEFSVLVSCAGFGTVIPVLASNSATFIGGSAGPATVFSGQTVSIVPGPLLTVTLKDGGGGTVTSLPDGVSCGGTCVAQFPANSTVTLTATPAGGHIFVGWSGACSGNGTCTVTMRSSSSVVAEFARAGQLSVTKVGAGQGTVTSRPVAINCGPSCGALLRAGTTVTLTARAAIGSRFVGWSGACSGQLTCVVTVNGGNYDSFGFRDVFAIFERR